MPRCVKCGEDGMDGITGNVAVNENLRETFSEVRWFIYVEGIPCKGERTRPCSVEEDPRTASTEFIACSFNDAPTVGEA